MATLAKLIVLYAKQKLILSKLKESETFTRNFVEGTDISEVRNRLENMSKIRDEFETTFLEIIASEDENTNPKTDVSEMEAFETRWYRVLSELQKISSSHSANNLTLNEIKHECNNDITSNNVRLPVINLPEFNGSYKEWLPFYDAFQSLIHENNTLSESQKFHYLKSCLRGDASRSIESLTISNSNYATAWSLLQRRYKNTRLIVQSHVQSIINTPEISKATADNLRKLTNDIVTNVEALRVLKIPVDSCDVFLTAIISNKLDYHTRREFENTLTTEIPTRVELIDFIEKKCIMLESMRQDTTYNKPKSMPIKGNNDQKSYNSLHKTAHHTSISKWSCHYCKQKHIITKCTEFLALSVEERRKQLEKRKLCIHCFRDNHNSENCKAAISCKVCNGKGHHTLLHKDEPYKNKPISSIQVYSTNAENLQSTSTNSCLQEVEPDVLLSTAVVLVEDSSGKLIKCRCLLDVGSQLNLLSKSLCDKLNVIKQDTNMTIWGINARCNRTSQRTDIIIHSLHTSYNKSIRCHILDRVTADIPINSFNKSRIGIPSHINLADSQFNISKPIDLILGAEVFWEVLSSGRIKLAENGLYLSETLLGWVIGGAVESDRIAGSVCNSVRSNHEVSDESNLDQILQKFWQQEEVEYISDAVLSAEERECENHFVNTVRRDESDGRFIVQLPFRNNSVKLGDSSNIARKRFISLERKFRQNPEFKKAYMESFHENLNLGIIERVPHENLDSHSVFFLPHSGVSKKSVHPPKIRIVFDGSAKSSNGLSLNDNLITGPNLQNDLFNILVRFRKHQVVVSCDMEKMFLQIKVHEEHKDFQRLFWRESEEDPIEQYRLTRVVFGLTNSPYTAMRCVRQLAEEAAKEYPEVSRILKKDIFMDDILCGADNVQMAIKLRNQLTSVLGGACFKLNKWVSNKPEILYTPGIGKQSPITLNFQDSDATKVLGLWWNPVTDTLCYKVQTPITPKVLTKRYILSCVAKMYDPIGLIAPVVIKGKILMQNLWTLGLGWDERVPEEVKIAWQRFIDEMVHLNNIQIPRKIVPECNCQYDLVAFCDASLRAYGANIYLRSQNSAGDIFINLICSKTRVSPVKVESLPRLELCAAVLAAKLMEKVHKSLEININNKYYFSDSKIVLHYIQSNANMWQVYVANRIAQIQGSSNIHEWYHVPTNHNPADIISRGAYAKEFINSALYWHGPEFLKLDKMLWPSTISIPSVDPSELPEKRKITLVVSADKEILPVFLKFSSFTKLQRVMAYVLKFITVNKNRSIGPLSGNNMKQARHMILRTIQHNEFNEEITSLVNKQPIAKGSRLRKLDPFIDNDGLLRVGGRIANADLAYDQKHPIILPSDHHVIKLLIQAEHVALLHAGPNQTLFSLRNKYWILRAKSTVKKIIHSCIPCFRATPKLAEQKMGNLPKVRLEPCRPFLNIGLDYLGPLQIKEGGRRSKRTTKVWVSLFVCLVTRAVHMEIVSNLTSESFIASLRRLISRRGKISKIYCDNATTFVGAKRELKEVSDFFKNRDKSSQFYDFLSTENITWKFIPPRSPNFGGIWERLVKSTKFHLNRVVGKALLTFEELNTFIIQAESIINSRPLTPISDDPADLESLTPSHFLIGEALTQFPEYDYGDIQSNRLSCWERVQQIKQHFWKRFSKEVLLQLQQRSKWHQASRQILKPGAMVLIAEETPPLMWKLGRIQELFPGSDGLPRVATVRTSGGTYKRSVRHLAILPIEPDDSSNKDKSDVRD